MNKYISYMIDLFTLGLVSVKPVLYAHHVVDYENKSDTFKIEERIKEIQGRGIDPFSPFGKHLMKKLRDDPYLPRPLIVEPYGDPVLGGIVEGGSGWSNFGTPKRSSGRPPYGVQ